ncbi:protein FAM189B [Chanos chanos]|uniref:Protein FAM189B n=1 Tax=Chanos chanos TaxID=29144 RepID=A0A6J2W5T7_CHACN|nr:protein FAM189B [Chanos chanos]
MPSPSDSSSVASMSGSRVLSGSRRGMSARSSARVLLYLGLCHLGLGAMVLAFSFTSLAFTSSPRVRQSCPFWAGFFVVASGIVGVISWRRPFTLVVSLFMLLSAVCVILSLAGSMLSCQNAQMVKSYLTCQVENGLCICCDPKQMCSLNQDETLVLYLHADCHSVRHQLKDLLFSACGLSILSTIVCTLSTVTCSIHIFSLDLLHLLIPHRSRSVNPECTTPQDAFLTNMMDFEEFVPPIPPPPYYPPEYTCSSETDAQSITYNGSMESPVPLYPTDCPPPYEAVIGQQATSQVTVTDTNAGELSGERGTSTGFSGEVSMDSGSLLMSEIVDIPDDSSPSEDSCLLEVGVGIRSRGASEGGEGGEYVNHRYSASHPSEGSVVGPHPRRCFRGERSNSCSSPSTYNTSTYRSPVLRRQALLASSCSQLEMIRGTGSQRCSIPEIRIRLCEPYRRGSASDSTAPPTEASLAPTQDCYGQAAPALTAQSGVNQRGGRDRSDSNSLFPLVRSHSEPGLSSSTDTGEFTGSGYSKGVSEGGSQTSTDTGKRSEAYLLPRTSLAPQSSSLPRKGSAKATTGQLPSKPPPANSLRLPKDCARSLGDLKVTRVLVARFLQRSKRNLAPANEHAGNFSQGGKRRAGGEGSIPFEQVLRNSWGSSRGQQYQQHAHHHRRGHHHSHSDSRYNARRRDDDPVRAEGIHLRSCGDLSFTSVPSLRRQFPTPHGSSGALYSESAL